ncbi:hypothetical protein HY29_16485 [Hyphomonas beringensis]|uniref:Uncharacterized protein n=1 Tax=Hyphomonas beringensis TaxID=1280946 RepID=A0A062UAR9_9PROT|nr:hypothetical protein [Hyphomonas beringensis]KCZ53669.1 hypothetical protein HY29_16485 [Hyphomonas beringensis]
MSKGDWLSKALRYLAVWVAGLSIPVLLILFVFVWAFQPSAPSVLEIPHSQEEQQCTQYRTTASEDSQAEPGAVNEVYQWRCEPELGPNFKRNNSKDKARTATDADLLAQERVAYWTAWIGGFTAFGLVALVLTFIETRRMTEATKEVALLENRAWLKLKLERNATLSSFGRNGAMFGANVKVKNVGSGVATNITLFTKFLAIPGTDDLGNSHPDFDAAPKTNVADSFVLFPGDKVTKTVGGWSHECDPQSGPHAYYVLIVAEYNLSFDKPGTPPRTTDVAIHLVTGMGWSYFDPEHFVEPEPDPTTPSSDGIESQVLWRPYRQRRRIIT